MLSRLISVKTFFNYVTLLRVYKTINYRPTVTDFVLFLLSRYDVQNFKHFRG